VNDHMSNANDPLERLTESATTPRSVSRRCHAAKGSRTVALGLSVVSTLSVAAYLHQSAESADATALDLASTQTPEPTSPTTASPTTRPSPAPAPTTPSTIAKVPAQTPSTTAPKASTTGSLKDGTFTGSTATTRWGPVQVRITVTGGRITAVDVPTFPSGDNKSIQINRVAVPRLVQSTLTAQSASVNSVSGATYTSTGYKTSLQSAIDKSRAAS